MLDQRDTLYDTPQAVINVRFDKTHCRPSSLT